MSKVIIEDSTRDTLNICIKEGLFPILQGEAGVGKNEILRDLFNQNKKKGQKLVRIALDGNKTSDDIVGRYSLKDGSMFFQEGVLVNAMKKGHWVILDEINASTPDVTFVLHQIADCDKTITLYQKDKTEIVKPHKDFRIFGTMNPSDRYEGTNILNQAFLDRTILILIKPLELTQEVDLLKDIFQKNPNNEVLSYFCELRKLFDSDKLSTYPSTRSLILCSRLNNAGLDSWSSVESGFIQKLNEIEREEIMCQSFAKNKTPSKVDPGAIKREIKEIREEHGRLVILMDEKKREMDEMNKRLINHKKVSKKTIEDIDALVESKKESIKKLRRSVKTFMSAHNITDKKELKKLKEFVEFKTKDN